MISKEKLKEILKELSRPKKFEVGFVDARRIVSDGLAIIGLDSTDILGFAKEANETRARRVKGAQAWYKRMYEDGWRFSGQFEYEGLLYAGFVIMERELPNKRLQELIETLSDETVVRTGSPMEIDRGPELPTIEERMETTHKALKKMGYKEDEITYAKLEGEIPIGSKVDIIPRAEGLPIARIPKTVKEPKEGFESDINDFIMDAQKEMKSLEELFFDETGKNAIWRGKETKSFTQWKQDRD